jgi:hypothetical protein
MSVHPLSGNEKIKAMADKGCQRFKSLMGGMTSQQSSATPPNSMRPALGGFCLKRPCSHAAASKAANAA